MDGNERIAQRAYSLWEQEGRPHGRDLDHWLSAQAEIDGGSRTDETDAPPPPAPGRRAKNAAS